MTRGIYVTGNIVVDCLLRPVDKLPEWGTTTYVDSIDVHLGGNGAASAYAAAMMGVPVRLVGVVGDDPFGEFARARLQSASVDLTKVRTEPGVATSTTVGLINQEGNRLFFHDPGTSASLRIDDIPFDAATIGDSAYFHFGSIFCLPKLRSKSRELLENARKAGLVTSLDTDWDIEDRWIEEFEPLCPLIDYLFLNREEARMLSGCAEPDQVGAFFRERGVKAVIVKLGDQGCAVFSGKGNFSLPPFAVPAVDTTGAGDCFCGAFLAGLCRGFDLKQAAELATAVAAHCVQKIGGTDGVVGYEQTRNWMQSARQREITPR